MGLHKDNSNLTFTYNPDLSVIFSSETEKGFDEEWVRQLAIARQHRRLLFNGPLFHVTAFQNTVQTINIQVINTDYRSYVCSRSVEFKNKFPEVLPVKPLAACVALVTADNKLLIEKRKGVDVHDGWFHVVGGFLDPSKDLNELGNPDPFKSIVREVKEETGLEIDFNQLVFLGLAEDIVVPHFELCFLAQIEMTSNNVIEKIKNSNTDGEFNTPILIEFSETAINEFLLTNENLFSPTGKICIESAISKVFKK